MNNKYLIIFTMFVLCMSCSVVQPRVSQLKTGMTADEVVKELKHYDLVLVSTETDTASNGVLIAELRLKGKSAKYARSQEKYWFYFVNSRLKIIQWGSSTEWDIPLEMNRVLHPAELINNCNHKNLYLRER